MQAPLSHRFAQELGSLLDDLVLNHLLQPRLKAFADARHFYLDGKPTRHTRPARQGKVAGWTDQYGNTHDLDFVLESGGNDEVVGTPVAFIEAAWRRYAEPATPRGPETPGAIVPGVEQHGHAVPFVGIVLVGDGVGPSFAPYLTTKKAKAPQGKEATQGTQATKETRRTQTTHCTLLYIPYEDVVTAFRSIDLAMPFDGRTGASCYAWAAQRLALLTADERLTLIGALENVARDSIEAFMRALERRLARYVARVSIHPLFCSLQTFDSVHEAIKGMDGIESEIGTAHFSKYELVVDYNTRDCVRASFGEKAHLIEFLRGL